MIKKFIPLLFIIALVCTGCSTKFGEFPPAEYVTAPENNGYKIGVRNFQSEYKDDITQNNSLQYKLDDKYIAFKPVEMRWNDNSFKTAQAVQLIKEKTYNEATEFNKMSYKEVFGKGIDLYVQEGERVWSKIIKIDSLENIPQSGYLEIEYAIDTNMIIDGWNKKDKLVITEKTRIGDYSYLEPAMVWDSSQTEICEDTEEGKMCHFENNRIKINSYFEEGKYVKQIPIEWLKNAQYPIYTDADITYGTEQEFESGAADFNQVKAIDTNKFVVCYMDDTDADAGKCVAGTVSDTTISYGDIKEFNSDIGAGYGLGVCKIDTNSFVVVYTGDAAGDDGYTIAGTTATSTAISYGDELEFYTSDTFHADCTTMSSSRYAITFRDYYDDGRTLLCSISGTTISCGTTGEFETSYASPLKTTKLDTDTFLIAYNSDDNNAYSLVVTTTDLTVEGWGTAVAFAGVDVMGGDNIGAGYIYTTTLDTNKFVITWANRNFEGTDWSGWNVIGTVDGTTITLGDASQFTTNNIAITHAETGVTKIDSTHYVFVYTDNDDSDQGKSNYSSFSGTTITNGTSEVFNVNVTTWETIDLISEDKVVICFSDTTGQCIIGDIAGAAPPTEPERYIRQIINF